MVPAAQLGFNLQPLLEQLSQDELNKFKSLLRPLSLQDELQHIPPTEVEEADGKQLAEILTNRCPSHWVEMVTIQVFDKMNRTDLSEKAKDELREPSRNITIFPKGSDSPIGLAQQHYTKGNLVRICLGAVILILLVGFLAEDWHSRKKPLLHLRYLEDVTISLLLSGTLWI
uniref:pyrin domain-containing protein 2 n=1 Tax=Panthera onca TaxID=9690 RepID=UPI002953C460|nr:pyrin domain-containing protein 2 [Panthera onca]